MPRSMEQGCLVNKHHSPSFGNLHQQKDLQVLRRPNAQEMFYGKDWTSKVLRQPEVMLTENSSVTHTHVGIHANSVCMFCHVYTHACMDAPTHTHTNTHTQPYSQIYDAGFFSFFLFSKLSATLKMYT